MQKIANKELLGRLIVETDEIIEFVKKELAPLSARQRNWQPDSGKWSIDECIEHLLITVDHYLPKIENGIESSLMQKQQPGSYYSPTMLGNYAVKTMKPTTDGQIKYKMKTLDLFDPENRMVGNTEICNEFVHQQERFKLLLQKASQVDLGRIRITTAVRFIKLKLGDCFRFIIAHNQRHILQAQKVMASKEFPDD